MKLGVTECLWLTGHSHLFFCAQWGSADSLGFQTLPERTPREHCACSTASLGFTSDSSLRKTSPLEHHRWTVALRQHLHLNLSAPPHVTFCQVSKSQRPGKAIVWTEFQLTVFRKKEMKWTTCQGEKLRDEMSRVLASHPLSWYLLSPESVSFYCEYPVYLCLSRL